MENRFLFHRVNFADNELPSFNQNKAKGWYNYGEDNKYPQFLIELFNKSPKHNAIVTQKSMYLQGDSYEIKTSTTETQAQAEDCLNNINAFENYEELRNKICQDFELFNGFYLEIIWNKAKTKIAEIYHLPFQNVRKGKNQYFYSKDWNDRKEEVCEYVAFNPTTRESKSIYEFKEYRAGQGVYPLPSYIGALKYIEIDTHISDWHLNSIKTGFSAQTMISFYKGIPTPEELREINRKFKRNYTGSQKAGEIILSFNDKNDKAPTIENLQPSDFDKQFLQLNEQVQTEIFVGHRISNPVIFGISQAGTLGQRNEIIEAYELFQTAYIEPRQKEVDNAFNYVFGYMCDGASIVTTNVPPIGLDYNDLYKSGLITNEEARQELGLPALTTVKVQSNLNDAINSLSPLVANNVLSNMTINEKRQLAGLPPIQGGDALPNGQTIAQVGMSSHKLEDLVISEFAKCGIDKVNFEKLEFATAGEVAILQILNDNPGLTIGEVAKYGNLDANKLMDAVTNLIKNGDIKSDNGALTVTKSGTSTLKDNAQYQLEIRYEYGLDPAFAGENEIIPTSREFCRRMISLNKMYTRSEIDTISARVGEDVWKYRGGWYTIPGTTDHIHHCRHIWNSKVVKRKL